MKSISRSSRAASIACVSAFVLSLAFGPSAANAVADSPLTSNKQQGDSEALNTISRVAPDILDETSTNLDTVVGDGGSLTIPDSSEGGVEARGVGFTIDYATSGMPVSNGLTEFSSEDTLVSAVAQETSTGVRVLSVINGANAPEEYRYRFDVPEGTQFVKNEAGYSLEFGDDLLGTVQEPWAYDSNGSTVPTSFTWEKGVLTQYVDLSSRSISYPVVADPAWSYAYKFATTKTAASNKALLKKCFNCYFPVSGAPKPFPKAGQLLPLKVAGLNFECKFKSESSGTNYFGFQFDATKNHVDKYGSNIIFQFRTIGGKKYLTVDAYILNDSIWVKNNLYRSGAIQSWTNFANNLNKA